VTVELVGEGKNNSPLVTAMRLFPLKQGDILDQAMYEKGKKNLVIVAYSEGFLDAGYNTRVLRVDRKENVATVHLVLDTGRQFVFGEIVSNQQVLQSELLKRYLPFTPGEPYNPAKLFELQSILYRTNFFNRVVVRGLVDEAAGQAIPVDIELHAPEHLNRYSFGVGYATDTGLRGKIDWSNRLLNSWGHQMRGSFQLAELENTVTLQFDIPRGDPRYNRLVHSLGYQDKTWDDTTTRLLTGSISHEYAGPRFKFSPGLEVRDEVYDVGDTSGDSTLFLPSLNAGAVFADDILHTKNGLQVSLGLLGSLDRLVSDVSFLQTTLSGKTVVSPLVDWRVIGRGALGVTLVDSIDDIPPSLRFYTGGDNSVRGYSYKSIGPEDSSGTVIGGRYLVVGSVEVERVIVNNWSLAAFWDVGTATDDLSLNFQQGVGGGIRFRLPFGQVRLDIASAVTKDGSPLRVHLTVGGDL
jgi:translocation and assembly module TamA